MGGIQESKTSPKNIPKSIQHGAKIVPKSIKKIIPKSVQKPLKSIQNRAKRAPKRRQEAQEGQVAGIRAPKRPPPGLWRHSWGPT